MSLASPWAQATAEMLARLGHEIHAIDFDEVKGLYFNTTQEDIARILSRRPVNADGYEWFQGDLTCLTDCSKAVDNVDAVVHAAGAVVTKDVPYYSIVGRVPASVKKWRWNIERILAHEQKLYEPRGGGYVKLLY